MLSNTNHRRPTLALGLAEVLFLVACSDPFQVSDSLGEWGGEGVAAVIETGSPATVSPFGIFEWMGFASANLMPR